MSMSMTSGDSADWPTAAESLWSPECGMRLSPSGLGVGNLSWCDLHARFTSGVHYLSPLSSEHLEAKSQALLPMNSPMCDTASLEPAYTVHSQMRQVRMLRPSWRSHLLKLWSCEDLEMETGSCAKPRSTISWRISFNSCVFLASVVCIRSASLHHCSIHSVERAWTIRLSQHVTTFPLRKLHQSHKLWLVALRSLN